jgi:hypothetical protein
MYIAVLNVIFQRVAMLSVAAPFLSGLSNYGKKYFYKKAFKIFEKKIIKMFLYLCLHRIALNSSKSDVSAFWATLFVTSLT